MEKMFQNNFQKNNNPFHSTINSNKSTSIKSLKDSHLEYTLETNRGLLSNGFDKRLTEDFTINFKMRDKFAINFPIKIQNKKSKDLKNSKENKEFKSKYFFNTSGKDNIKAIFKSKEKFINPPNLTGKFFFSSNNSKIKLTPYKRSISPIYKKYKFEKNSSYSSISNLELSPDHPSKPELHSRDTVFPPSSVSVAPKLSLSEVLKKNVNLIKNNIIDKLKNNGRKDSDKFAIPWKKKKKKKKQVTVNKDLPISSTNPDKSSESQVEVRKRDISKRGTVISNNLDTVKKEIEFDLKENDIFVEKMRRASVLDKKRRSVSLYGISQHHLLNNNLPILDKLLEVKKSNIKAVTGKSRSGVNSDGTKKINQDNYIIKESLLPNLPTLDSLSLFSVLDGHGQHGHFISNTVKKSIISFFSQEQLYYTNHLTSAYDVYTKLTANNYQAIKDSYYQADHDLYSTKFEINLSGTTLVTVFLIGKKLICANTGDSRAIVGVEMKGHRGETYIPFHLSRDHKPELPEEKERIEKCGGYIAQYKENDVPSGPYRVWVKNENFPGLAMSRSIGDFIAKSIGVIPEPEIVEIDITHETKFFVLASDGIWEFLSDKKVVDILSYYYKLNDIEKAAEKLIQESTRCWKREDQTIDDITLVIVFL